MGNEASALLKPTRPSSVDCPPTSEATPVSTSTPEQPVHHTGPEVMGDEGLQRSKINKEEEAERRSLRSHAARATVAKAKANLNALLQPASRRE